MSTKSTIILTDENEHLYHDGTDGTIVLEMAVKNFKVLINDKEGIVIEIQNNGSELHDFFNKLYPNPFE